MLLVDVLLSAPITTGHPKASSLSALVNLFVNLAHLLAPELAVAVRHVENRLAIPMLVISQEGYLLIDAFERVAYDSPGLIFTSTVAWQFTHRVFSVNDSPPVLC